MCDFRKDQQDTMNKAIYTYGSSHQILKAIEELGELERALIKKLMHQKDNHNLIEETADVEVMLYQIKQIYGIFSEVHSVRNEKLQRLKTRLGD